MFKTVTYLSLGAALAMSACTTTYDQSPYHSQSQSAVTYSNSQTTGYAQPLNASYSNTQAMTAHIQPASCPMGTTPHSSGTCLLDDSSASVQVSAFTANPAPRFQQVQPALPAQNLMNASTAPAAPSAYMGTDVTRQYGGTNYRVQTGDTVYSLARRLCVPVTMIQSTNSLDANFGIQIGQGLKLPASQC